MGDDVYDDDDNDNISARKMKIASGDKKSRCKAASCSFFIFN